MVSNKNIRILTLFLFFVCFISAAGVSGQSHEEAIPVGKSVNVQINCSNNPGGIEVYDATITLMDILRGDEALVLLKKAHNSNLTPDNKEEYILVRVSFIMKARGAPGDKTYELDRPFQFTAISDEFEEYESPEIILPEPSLKRTVASGQYAEGWIGLKVMKKDKKPLLMFDPSSGGAWSRGKLVFFRLYR